METLAQYLTEQERILGKRSYQSASYWARKFVDWSQASAKDMLSTESTAGFQEHLSGVMKPGSIRTGLTWVRRFQNWMTNGNGGAPDTVVNDNGETEEFVPDTDYTDVPTNGSQMSPTEIARQVASEVAQQAVDSAVRQLAQSQVSVNTRGKRSTVNIAVPQGLARMFPTASQHMVIRKRVGDGPTARPYHVGNFTQADLQGFINIEGFIQQQVLPTWGAGDYIVSLTDASGTELKSEAFPVGMPQNYGMGLGFMKELVQTPIRHDPLPPPMPMPMTMSMSSSTDVRLERLEKLIEQSVSHREDPKDVLFRKMVDRLDLLERERNVPPPQPPPPPPPPPVAPPPQMDIVGLLGKLAEITRPPLQQQPALDMERMMSLIERMSNKPEKTTDWMDMLTKLATVKKEIFGDMVQTQKEVAEKIAQVLNAPQPDFLEEAQRMAQAMELFKQIASNHSGGDTLSTVAQIFGNLPHLGKIFDKARMLTDSQTKLKQIPAEVSKQPEVIKKSPPPPLELPEGTQPYVDSLVRASGDREYIQSTLQLFEYLGKYPGWHTYYSACYELAKQGDRKALAYLDALLRNFVQRGTITEDKRGTIVGAFETHWETILEVAFSTESSEEETEVPVSPSAA
mgnify:CR=1 FL=1